MIESYFTCHFVVCTLRSLFRFLFAIKWLISNRLYLLCYATIELMLITISLIYEGVLISASPNTEENNGIIEVLPHISGTKLLVLLLLLFLVVLVLKSGQVRRKGGLSKYRQRYCFEKQNIFLCRSMLVQYLQQIFGDINSSIFVDPCCIR